MVEILFAGGRARELQESDISSLIDMCRDEEILKYFFSSGNRNMEMYWRVQLAEQRWWKSETEGRHKYVLAIEQEDIVKGCLILEVKEDKNNRKKPLNNAWLDSVQYKKMNGVSEWVEQLDPVMHRKRKYLSREPKPCRSDGPLIERSYFVGGEYRRQGIATAVGQSALTFAFETLGARKVVAKCLESNKAVRSVLEGQGFRVDEKATSTMGPKAGERVFIYDLSSTVWDEIYT